MSKYKKKPPKSKPITQFALLLPILIVIGLVPLIVRLKVLQLSTGDIVWQSDKTTTITDLFSYYKGQLLIAMAIVSLVLLIQTLYTKKWTLKNHLFFTLLLSYIVVICLSALFSNYHHVALIGYNERYEGLFILISYILIFFYTATSIQNTKQVKLIVNTWMITSLILFLIGLSQYFDMDFITSDIGRLFILPSKYQGVNALTDSDTTRNVYQTLYHYNYVSFYAAIGFPFFLVLAITESSLTKKLIYSLITITFIINQVISFSRNGYIGFLVGLIFVIFFLRKKLFNHWKILLPIGGLVLVSLLVFISTSESLTASRIRDGFKSLGVNEDYKLNSIQAENQTLHIDHDQLIINIVKEKDNLGTPFVFKDANNQSLVSSYDQASNTYTLEGISPNSLSYEIGSIKDNPSLILNFFNQKWFFTYVDNQFYYVNPDLTTSQIINAPSMGFVGRESFASERGYIWSRTFPLILKNGLFGSGPDTFALVFPQSDYVAKYNAYNTNYMIVDKPHNVYLNYASNTGIVSLILLIVFWFYYLYTSFRLYFKCDLGDYSTRIGIASTVSIISYFASGLFNDTNLSVTPTFWVILGLGYAMNYKINIGSHKKISK